MRRAVEAQTFKGDGSDVGMLGYVECVGGDLWRQNSAHRYNPDRCQQLATVHREWAGNLSCHMSLLCRHQGGQAIRWFVVSDHIPKQGTTLLRISRLVRADALVLMREEFGRVGKRNQLRRPAIITGCVMRIGDQWAYY